MHTPDNTPLYTTLESILAKKGELHAEIAKKNEEISKHWNSLFAPQKPNSKGELVTSIISNGITAFDTFMLVRKLMVNYGHIFKRGKKKR